MAVRFHELPPEVFGEEARPYIQRLNRELRDLFGLEGALTDPRDTKRSDLTIARAQGQTVDVSRVSGTLNIGTSLPSTINAGDTAIVGSSDYASPVNHQHAVDTATAGDIADISNTAAAGGTGKLPDAGHVHAFAPALAGDIADVGTTAAAGSTGKLADAGHVHNLTAAGDANYLRRNGGNTITGIIIPDSDAVRHFGSNTAHYATVHGQVFGADDSNGASIALAALVYKNAGGADTGIIAADGVLQAVASANNHWRAAEILVADSIYLALESLTPLNALAAATAAYDMNGNVLTDFGGCPSSNAATLSIVADPADGAAAVGVKYVWDANVATTHTVGAVAHSWWWRDNVDSDKEMLRLWSQQHAAMADTDVMLSSGAWNTGKFILSTRSGYLAAQQAAIVMTQGATSYVDFYMNNAVKLRISTAGSGVIQTGASGVAFQSSGGYPVRFDTANGTTIGQIFYRSAGTFTAGASLSSWSDGLQGLTDGDRGCGRLKKESGGEFSWYAGQGGYAAVAPTDGKFLVHGWTEASTASDQAGTDAYYGGGAGTGNATGGGDIFFQTPDAGASGTTVQSLSTKMTLSREGDLGIKDDAALGFDTDGNTTLKYNSSLARLELEVNGSATMEMTANYISVDGNCFVLGNLLATEFFNIVCDTDGVVVHDGSVVTTEVP